MRRATIYFDGHLLACLGLLAWLSLLPCPWARGEEADGQWGLAQHLMKEKEYYRAITEYKRFLYHFPESPKADEARLRIVEAYVKGQWWKDGIKKAQELLGMEVSEEIRARALFFMGVCQVRLGLLGDARESLVGVVEVSKDPELRGRAEYLIGETHALQGDWDEAIRFLESVTRESSLGRMGLDRAHLVRSRIPSPEKSPWVAGALAAILPGAGHLYTERYFDAGLVFSVNAAFASAAVEAIRKDNLPLAGGLAAAELVWYAGNIFSAVGSAHKYNRALHRELWEQVRLPDRLLEELPPLGTERRGDPP